MCDECGDDLMMWLRIAMVMLMRVLLVIVSVAVVYIYIYIYVYIYMCIYIYALGSLSSRQAVRGTSWDSPPSAWTHPLEPVTLLSVSRPAS